MAKKINPQAFLEFICFAFFAALIFYLTVSGKYLSYVTPKMAPYLYFTSAVTLVWAASRLPGIFRPQHKIRAAHCLVLVIPILFLLLPHSSVSASGMSSVNLNGSLGSISGNTSITAAITNKPAAEQSGAAAAASESASPSSMTDPVSVSDDSTQADASSAPAASSGSGASGASDQADAAAQYDDSYIKQYGLSLSEDGSIIVSDEQFYPWLSEVFTNMKRYEGVRITVKGFVFKDSAAMKTNEFVPARLLMYCCTADLSPCGILCEYDKASGLKENSWVTVTGVIHIRQYQGEDAPQITVTSISPAEKPKDEYVYPW